MGALTLDLGRYERTLREQGFRNIAGADEAGRGALAGPLVAAAVILPDAFDLDGINDSKQLTANQRSEAYARIVRDAVAWSVSRCTPTRIDRRGLHKTNVHLLRRCITQLAVAPDYVLTDGFPVRRLDAPILSIKKGDCVTASVAAASIVAKVTRDRIMDRYHRRFPMYGFDTNRGYGTDAHRDAIRAHGPSPIHRYSFKGLRTGYYDSEVWSRRATSDDAVVALGEGDDA
ncbi:MAG TPA: ribonuclease HII [Actinomycetota bacterium]|nr:ribonuclease HII [Actinomycetota bacterium]